MTKTQFLGSVSPQSILNIGVAYASIIGWAHPAVMVPGQAIVLGTLLKNTGDTAATCHIDFDHTNIDGNFEFTGERSELVTLNGGEQVWLYTTVNNMPNRDIKYRGRTYHDDVSPDADETSEERLIEALNLVDTTLTCVVPTEKVAKLGKYVQSGRLTRNDTGAGVPDQSLIMERLDTNPQPPPDKVWFGVANAVTDVNGNYAVEVTAPNPVVTPAIYPVRTEYIGSQILGLAASLSPATGIQIGIVEALENLAVIGLAGAGAFLLGSAVARTARKKAIVLPITLGGIVVGYAIQKARGRI